ncbi:MAG: histidine phosphatase family protein [Thermoleophilaceae bacterium]
MTVLLLARHGETDWTRSKRWQGHADPPLNARGREQARALARVLLDVPLDAIYSSDLRRASETAAIVAHIMEIEVRLEPELRENDFGDWTGLTRDEVERRFPEGALRRRRGLKGWRGGESYEEMAERVVRALTRIAAPHAGKQILVVTHNGPIRATHAHALGIPYAEYRQTAKSIRKGTVSAVSLEKDVWNRLDSALGALPAQALFVAQAVSEWNPVLLMLEALPA